MGKADEEMKPVPVRRRSAARLAAVQVAYQSQMSGQSVIAFLPTFLEHYSADIKKSFRVKDLDNEHLNALVSAVEASTETLDEQIADCLANDWTIDRLTVIDKVLLRAGTQELAAMPHLPARAVVSEYAALADVCGCDVGFINAVLDRVARNTRTVEMASQGRAG